MKKKTIPWLFTFLLITTVIHGDAVSAPEVNIRIPYLNAWLNNILKVEAEVNTGPSCTGIAEVHFYINGNLIKSFTPGGICEGTFLYSGEEEVVNGRYSFKVAAIDANGVTGEAVSAGIVWNSSQRINGILPGDVNNDELINVVDALMIARYSVGIQDPGFIQEVADLDFNGIINIVDAYIALYLFFGPL